MWRGGEAGSAGGTVTRCPRYPRGAAGRAVPAGEGQRLAGSLKRLRFPRPAERPVVAPGSFRSRRGRRRVTAGGPAAAGDVSPDGT